MARTRTEIQREIILHPDIEPYLHAIDRLMRGLKVKTPAERVKALEILMRVTNNQRAVIIVSKKLKNPYRLEVRKLRIRKSTKRSARRKK